MISKDVGRLLVLSAFVALCAIVLFSSEVDAKGYGDISPYKGSVKRINKEERTGYAFGLKKRRHGYLKKFGRRGNKKNFGRGRGLGKRLIGGKRGRGYVLKRGHGKRSRGYGRNLRKSFRQYKNGKRGRGYGGKRRGGKYRGRKGKKYRGKARKGYPKKKDENC